MPNVALDPCGPIHRETLANLFQLYTYDFTEFWAGSARGEVGEDGRYEPYPYLEEYWTRPDRSAWLIRADSHIAGFALINRYSHSGLASDFNMAEFFVLRKHRRRGVGRAAALKLIGERPGLWELAVARPNSEALWFWRRVAAELSTEVEEMDVEDPRWDGYFIRVRVA